MANASQKNRKVAEHHFITPQLRARASNCETATVAVAAAASTINGNGTIESHPPRVTMIVVFCFVLSIFFFYSGVPAGHQVWLLLPMAFA